MRTILYPGINCRLGVADRNILSDSRTSDSWQKRARVHRTLMPVKSLGLLGFLNATENCSSSIIENEKCRTISLRFFLMSSSVSRISSNRRWGLKVLSFGMWRLPGPFCYTRGYTDDPVVLAFSFFLTYSRSFVGEAPDYRSQTHSQWNRWAGSRRQ